MRSVFRSLAVPIVVTLAIVSLMGGVSPARADDAVVVSASVDAKQIPLGETLTYTIEIRGAGMSGVSPTPPAGLVNLQVAGGPSTSTSFSFVNGAVSSSRSSTWYLAPQATGKAHIPAQDVKVGGKIYRTEPIDLDVLPAGSGTRAQAPGPPLRGSPAGPGREPSQADLRLESELSTDHVYVGQPLVLTTRLITRLQVVDVSAGNDPTLPGFLLEESNTDVVSERVFREGREYRSFVLMRRILTPTTPGKTVVPPETRTIRIRSTGNRDVFDFFSPRVMEVNRVTQPVTIEALAPPIAGRPTDFSGAVGVFKMDVTADRKDASVGDAVGVKVVLNGNGNLKTVDSPSMTPSADFRIFDPRVEEKSAGFKPRTYTKTWSYVLTPLSPGEIPFPTISFSYFDPEAKAYRRLSSPGTRLLVKRTEPGAAPAGTANAITAQREVQTLQRDIRFLKPLEGPLAMRPRGAASFWWVWAAIALSVLAQPAAWLVQRKGGPSILLSGGWRGRARRRALKEIAQAGGREVDSVRVSSAAATAVLRFIGDRCRVPASGLTYEEISEELARRGVGEGSCSELRALLEMCDLYRFAPAGGGRGQVDDLLSRARSLVDRLDREIGRAA